MAHLPCFLGSHLWLTVLHYLSQYSPPEDTHQGLARKVNEASSRSRESTVWESGGQDSRAWLCCTPALCPRASPGSCLDLSYLPSEMKASLEDHRWALGASANPLMLDKTMWHFSEETIQFSSTFQLSGGSRPPKKLGTTGLDNVQRPS